MARKKVSEGDQTLKRAIARIAAAQGQLSRANSEIEVAQSAVGEVHLRHGLLKYARAELWMIEGRLQALGEHLSQLSHTDSIIEAGREEI